MCESFSTKLYMKQNRAASSSGNNLWIYLQNINATSLSVDKYALFKGGEPL